MKNNVELIRKLRLKKGYKYILIFPESTGLSNYDLESIDYKLMELGIKVKSTRGIKAIEVK